MNGFFEMLGVPLGIVMSFIYSLIKDYFLTIFVFTFLVRLVLFPLSLKQQKAACDRARLAPRLERLQKKYGQDRNKLMMKQQELYERHGVKMTPGCLPMLLQMVVLMGVIGVIYTPLSQLANPKISDPVISVAQQAIVANDPSMDAAAADKEFYKGYYGELNLMMKCDETPANAKQSNKDAIIKAFDNPSKAMLEKAYGVELKDDKAYQKQKDFFKKDVGDATAMYNRIDEMSDEFNVFGIEGFTMLQKPWTDAGFGGISVLWIIPLISGVTAFFVSWISLRYSRRSMPKDQPGQGCTNNMMLIYMPAFSAFIGFTVPGAVGIYWIFSNLISMIQTVIVNKIYDPGKARMEAEAEMAERRRKKAEDKKRLAMARQREEAEARKAEQALERQREESREMNKKKKKKGASSGATKPAEETTEENGTTDAVDTQPVENTDEESAE